MCPRPIRFAVALLIAFLALVLPQGSFAQSSKNLRDISIQWYQGEVHLSVPGRQQLVRVQLGINVGAKDLSGVSVITNAGWVEYWLEQKLFVAQESDTSLTFVSAEDVQRGFVLRLALDRGTSTFTADPGRHNAILIQASGIEVRAEKKARFRMDADPDSARVTVFDGKVLVTSDEGTREVASGFSLTYKAGSLSRLAQRRPAVRSYGGGSWGYAPAGFATASMNYYRYRGGPCMSWGYPTSISIGISSYGGLGDCLMPDDWIFWYSLRTRPVSVPPQVGPAPTPTPTPAPPVAPGRPVIPRRGVLPRKFADERALLITENETRSQAATRTAAPGVRPPRGTPAADVPVATGARMEPRESASNPRRDTPWTNRVDVQPIPRERASGGNEFTRPGGPGGSREPSGQWQGSNGRDRQGQSPSSGSGSPGGYAGGGSPAGGASSGSSPGGGAAPSSAPPPAAPAAPPSQATPRTGKPD